MIDRELDKFVKSFGEPNIKKLASRFIWMCLSFRCYVCSYLPKNFS
jgi:hypothetical protein